VLGLGFCIRVRVLVSVTGSVSYLNYNFVLFYTLWLPLSNADSLITYSATGNAAVIIDSWRRDHEFVIIASAL